MVESVEHKKSGFTQWLNGTTGGLLLMGLVILCYAYTSRFDFLWDDDTYLVNNVYLRDLAGLSRMWTTLGATPQYYPMTFTSFWIEYQVFGANPVVSHVVNFLLHGISAVLLWKILQELKVPGAWLAAAIFAVHPIHVESVVWISERKNTLSLAFGLGALLIYLRYIGLIEKPVPTVQSTPEEDEGGMDLSLPDDPKRLYLLFFILFLCAILSKTTLAVLPGVILVLVWWKRGRITLQDVRPLIVPLILAVAGGLLTSWIERHPFIVGATGQPWSYGILDRIVLAGQVCWFYVWKLFLPHPFAWGLPEGMQMSNLPATVISVGESLRQYLPSGLMFNYPRWVLNASNPVQWLGVIGVLVVLGGLFVMRKKWGRGVLAGVLIYLGCLVPAMGFANVYPMRFSWVADHFVYVASIGLIVLFAAGLARLCAKRGSMIPLAGGLIIVLGTFTVLHSLSFANPQRLWTNTLIRNDRSWLAATNLGAWFRSEADRLTTAVLPIEQDPEKVKKLIADYYSAAGKWLDAAEQMNPTAWEIPFQKALLALRFGKTDQAMLLAMESERIAAEQGIRQFVGPKFLRATLYTQMNDPVSALQVYQEIQELEPKMSDKMPTMFAEARMKAADLKLKSLQLTEGQPLEESHMKVIGEVIEDLTIASEIAPRLSGPKIELAKVLLKLGRTSESADLLNQVLSEDKTNVEAMLVTAEALVQSGNPSYAAAQLARLIEIKPDHFEARLMLGRLLVQIGRKDDAVRELQALVRMQPKNESAKSLLQQITGSTTRPTTQTSGG